MAEANVMYPNAKFTKSKGNVTVTPSPIETTYSEVGRLNTEPSAGSQQQTGGSKVTAERVAIVVLLTAAVIGFGFTRYKHNQITEHLQKLTDENAALRKNITERRCEAKTCSTVQKPCPEPPAEPCRKCEDGWEQNGNQCYYFSTDKLTWIKARDECRRRGGDLVKIDSEDEQSFLMQKVSVKMVNPDDKFWIGLTDSEEEGRWLWADGTPLNKSLTFWSSHEPDDWKGKDKDGEDCVRMGELNASVLKCWFDQSCENPQKRICEKSAETGRSKCVRNEA